MTKYTKLQHIFNIVFENISTIQNFFTKSLYSKQYFGEVKKIKLKRNICNVRNVAQDFYKTPWIQSTDVSYCIIQCISKKFLKKKKKKGFHCIMLLLLHLNIHIFTQNHEVSLTKHHTWFSLLCRSQYLLKLTCDLFPKKLQYLIKLCLTVKFTINTSVS